MDIYLRLIGDLGLDESVLIEGTDDIDDTRNVVRKKGKEDANVSNRKNVPNRLNRT